MQPDIEAETNPFKPGAGHPPPYLAGREQEIEQFRIHLQQEEILKNVILTGLRGTGKTVLMDSKYKNEAQRAGWVWVGSDFGESSFLSELNICTRLLTDLSVYSSTLAIPNKKGAFGFDQTATNEEDLGYDALVDIFTAQPGLTSDKLKATLAAVWNAAKSDGTKGIIFAYDEAQLVADRKDKEQYPLAVLLETFQSLQKSGAKYFLLLTGLPTLFARLVESRTYAERMFTVQELGRLEGKDARKAIEVPVAKTKWKFTETAIQKIIDMTDGYPYFIQFFGRETFDHLKVHSEEKSVPIPLDSIMRKLDSDFFAGRWEQLTDRMREFLYCVSDLENVDGEFTISDIVDISKRSKMKAFTRGDVSQMLPRLIERGLVYKNRHGKYSFAVPLFGRFLQRKRKGAGLAHQRSLFPT